MFTNNQVTGILPFKVGMSLVDIMFPINMYCVKVGIRFAQNDINGDKRIKMLILY